MKFRLSRHCYDKMWRCPGWAGGGWHYRREPWCRGGSVNIQWPIGSSPPYRFKLWWVINMQFHRHAECGTIAIPHITRWLDPSYVRYKLSWKFRRD